jgi:hypothetical protein
MTNTSVKQFPQRPSPLATTMVAAGHYYDIHTGLVKPGAGYQPPTGSGSNNNSDQYQPDGCLPGYHLDEAICLGGVVSRPPKRPTY